MAKPISRLRARLRCVSRIRSRGRGASPGKIVNESGAAVVILAVTMIVVLGFMALVADVGQFYLVRSRLQSAADSAALAGAQDIADKEGETTARSSAENYVDRNITGPHETVVTFPQGGTTWTITPRGFEGLDKKDECS